MMKFNKASAVVAVIFLVLFLLGFCFFGFITINANADAPHTQYGLLTVVTNVSETNNIVTCVDFNGNEWTFSSIDDWTVNDFCCLIMDDNGTEIIYDDIIISTRYNGFLDGVFGYDANGNPTATNIRTKEIIYVPQNVTETETIYIEVPSETIDASENQLEEAFNDGYRQGECDGYADGYWQAYRDCMSDYGLEPKM